MTTYSFRTKDGKNASLVIKRKTTETEASLVLTDTMHVEGEPQKWVVHASGASAGVKASVRTFLEV
jgi:hypothetical protein